MKNGETNFPKSIELLTIDIETAFKCSGVNSADFKNRIGFKVPMPKPIINDPINIDDRL